MYRAMTAWKRSSKLKKVLVVTATLSVLTLLVVHFTSAIPVPWRLTSQEQQVWKLLYSRADDETKLRMIDMSVASRKALVAYAKKELTGDFVAGEIWYGLYRLGLIPSPTPTPRPTPRPTPTPWPTPTPRPTPTPTPTPTPRPTPTPTATPTLRFTLTPASVWTIGKGWDLYTRWSCDNCHGENGQGRVGQGPKLAGIYGGIETLADGSQVVVDDVYLRESIEDPLQKIVKGFQPVMPSLRLADDEMMALIAYIASLK